MQARSASRSRTRRGVMGSPWRGFCPANITSTLLREQSKDDRKSDVPRYRMVDNNGSREASGLARPLAVIPARDAFVQRGPGVEPDVAISKLTPEQASKPKKAVRRPWRRATTYRTRHRWRGRWRSWLDGARPARNAEREETGRG